MRRVVTDFAFGRRLGPCTTDGTVGSILSEYVPGRVPVVCLSSGYLSSSMTTVCIISIRPRCELAFPDNNGFWSTCNVTNSSNVSVFSIYTDLQCSRHQLWGLHGPPMFTASTVRSTPTSNVHGINCGVYTDLQCSRHQLWGLHRPPMFTTSTVGFTPTSNVHGINCGVYTDLQCSRHQLWGLHRPPMFTASTVGSTPTLIMRIFSWDVS